MNKKLPCEHLNPAKEFFVKKGATVLGVVPANGTVRFVHQLSHGPNRELAAELASKYKLEFWVNADSHYPKESFLSCNACKLALCWPSNKGSINAT